MYSASIEWLAETAGVIRLHECDAGIVGDPYVWAATLYRVGQFAEFKGVCLAPPKRARRAISDAMYAAGIRFHVITRKIDGSTRTLIRAIRPPRTSPA